MAAHLPPQVKRALKPPTFFFGNPENVPEAESLAGCHCQRRRVKVNVSISISMAKSHTGGDLPSNDERLLEQIDFFSDWNVEPVQIFAGPDQRPRLF